MICYLLKIVVFATFSDNVKLKPTIHICQYFKDTPMKLIQNIHFICCWISRNFAYQSSSYVCLYRFYVWYFCTWRSCAAWCRLRRPSHCLQRLRNGGIQIDSFKINELVSSWRPTSLKCPAWDWNVEQLVTRNPRLQYCITGQIQQCSTKTPRKSHKTIPAA